MPSRGIKLGGTENIHVCPAVENHQQCGSDPRWVEESWSAERIRGLMRARADLDYRYDSFDREHRISRSKTLMHGQVCLGHAEHARRLHTLSMIRRDARSDLRGPRNSIRKNRTRVNRKRTVGGRAGRVTRSMSPEQARAALPGPARNAVPVFVDHAMADPIEPQTPITSSPPNELMLRAHLQDSQNRETHLEHKYYMASLEHAELRQQLARSQSENADLHRHNLRVTAKNDQQKRELDQARNLLRDTANASARSAQGITNFLTANNA